MVSQSGHYNWHCCCCVFLLICCIVPFIRSMLASAAAKQMINVSVRPTGIDIGCINMHTVGPELDELDKFV